MNKIILKNGLFGSIIVSAMLVFISVYMKANMVILLTYMEILPLGILFSLVSALIFKKK